MPQLELNPLRMRTLSPRNETEEGESARLGTRATMKTVSLAVLSMAATAFLWSQTQTQIIDTTAPDVAALLQSMERRQQQNPAQSRAYEVTRKYKVFRADDKQLISEITTHISFTPPDTKTYKITQASGSPRGEKIVRAILDQETAAAKNSDDNQIS